MSGEGTGSVVEGIRARRFVLFDLDGTVTDTLDGIVRTARSVLRDYGLPEERLVDAPKLVGPPFPQAFSMVFGLSEGDAREVTRRYRDIYDNLGPAAWPAFEGIGKLVRDLRSAGRVVATASSKRQAMVRRCLADSGLEDAFDLVIGRVNDGGETKAQTIARALDALGASPSQAVMVGDRYFDVDGASANDVPCVGVTYGHTAPRSELERAGAVAIAGSVDELRRILLG